MKLDDCTFRGWGRNNCRHSKDVSISCGDVDGESVFGAVPGIRLIDNDNEIVYMPRYSGIIEIFHDWEWKQVCHNQFSPENAKVACRQLGLEGGSLVDDDKDKDEMEEGNSPKEGNHGVMSIGNVYCTGDEETLVQCVSVKDEEKCRKLDSLSIECGMPKISARHIMWGVRMKGTSYTFEPKFYGRLEVLNEGAWGTVCDDAFDNRDARVACRQMGLANGRSLGSLRGIEKGSGHIWLDNMECRGNEPRLDQCKFKGWGKHNCKHREDVHIECEGLTLRSAIGASTGIRVVNEAKTFWSMARYATYKGTLFY